jgi:hypothetical protein
MGPIRLRVFERGPQGVSCRVLFDTTPIDEGLALFAAYSRLSDCRGFSVVAIDPDGSDQTDRIAQLVAMARAMFAMPEEE